MTFRNSVHQQIEDIYRLESRRVLATLIRLLGDFDLAEEAVHDAFTAALKQWPEEGLPQNPRAWLISAGRFKAIDRLRQRARFDASLNEIAHRFNQTDEIDDENIEDDRLRLIFTCCHPGLSIEAQLALTLREVCDLTTEEIARAFLTSPATLAQRIVRAKAKIRTVGIPYEVPGPADMTERLDSVLRVIYLVFNEGYSASAGDTIMRSDLAQEAIRLARLLMELLPEPEVQGLLALMLLHDARRDARLTSEGDLILLEEQDRSRWNKQQITEGAELIQRSLRSRRFGAYTLQAAVAGVHAEAARAGETDWAEIVGLYDVLLRIEPSPVIALNRAVALALRDGPESGLQVIDALLAEGALKDYYLIYAARADFCRRLGRTAEAISAYQQALTLTLQAPEKRFLQKRLEDLARLQ